MNPRAFESAILGLVALLVLGILFLAALAPAKEAATYNKFKDPAAPAATYWDAVWADLRITTK